MFQIISITYMNMCFSVKEVARLSLIFYLIAFLQSSVSAQSDTNTIQGTNTTNTGINNSFFGFNAGKKNVNDGVNGVNNVFVGAKAGAANKEGANNVFLGYKAGGDHVSGNGNVMIGQAAGLNNLYGKKNVFIGTSAGANETGDHKLYIANTNDPTPLIYGEFDNDRLAINGVLDINVSNEIVGAFNVGENNVVSSNFTFTMGKEVEASNWGAVAMGYLSETSGQMSMSIGYDAQASGYSSFSLGTYTKALNDYSQAFGKSSEARGQVSTAFGEGTYSDAQFSLALGRWNVGGGSNGSWVETDPIFEIGNGSNDQNRSNALTVLKNGKSTFANDMTVEGLLASNKVAIGGLDIPTHTGFDYDLAVEGDVIANKIKVMKTSDWFDTVFDNDYNLLPLEDLADYIQENQHLPEIPTDEEIEENGMDVFKMNALLLKKVEELTLYQINLMNELHKLESELHELSTKVE